MDAKAKAPKEKRRNNEKRKEKSRDAARTRRSKETEIFTALGNALPLSKEQVNQLDKASVMRLAIAYLRVRDMIGLVPQDQSEKSDTYDADGSQFLKSIGGFLLVLSSEGDFVYLSENVSDYLGITQIDLMGQNVFEYSYACDHEEIKDMLSSKSQEDSDAPKSVFIRLKCTLTSKGRSVNLKSATFKVIHCTGHMVQQKSSKKDSKDKGSMQSCFVAVAKPIPHPSNIDTPLPRQTFLTKHSLDMKFTHADDKFMTDLLGYSPDDLIGKSVYEYHHAMDSDSILAAYKCLYSKGQCETNQYRFLAKTGGYVWVVTQATMIYDKSHKMDSVVCVNYVVSGVERADEPLSAGQAEHAPLKAEPPQARRAEPTATEKAFRKKESVTEKVFAPRTEEMSKGYLMFSDKEPGITMLKEEVDVEADDLTHLAPVAGDMCVPLDEPVNGSLPFADLDELLLIKDGGLDPLLGDGVALGEPFTSYRDLSARDESSAGPSPQMLSPNLSKSPDCSLPSLSSPSDSLLDEDQMSTFMNLQMEDEPDLILKAPFIPMNLTEDLPLYSDMWNGNEKKQLDSSGLSLAQLLSPTVNKCSLKSRDHGGGLHRDQSSIDEIYNKKNAQNDWSTINSRTLSSPTSRTNSSGPKRTHAGSDANDNILKKRARHEPKEKMSAELLRQLMSGGTGKPRGRPRSNKGDWLIEAAEVAQKAACVSQPSDSVLMNLLNECPRYISDKMEVDMIPTRSAESAARQNREILARRSQIRKNSLSLLEPEGNFSSLMDLTQQDYEVNAPVNSLLLQGEELLIALEATGTI